MAHDVFLSYSFSDKQVADRVCAGIEVHDISCWIAPRDILPGQEWAEAIVNAIDNCTAMVLIFSREANTSKQVLREVERAINAGKVVVPFRIEDCKPTKSMAYYLSVPQWLDAFRGQLDDHIDRLVEIVNKRVCLPEVTSDPTPDLIEQGTTGKTKSSKPVDYSPALLNSWEECLLKGAWSEAVDCRDFVLLQDLCNLLRDVLVSRGVGKFSIDNIEVALVELYRNAARHAASPVAKLEIAANYKYRRFQINVCSQGKAFNLEDVLKKYNAADGAEKRIHGLQNLLTRGSLNVSHEDGWNKVKFSCLLAAPQNTAEAGIRLEYIKSNFTLGSATYGIMEWCYLFGITSEKDLDLNIYSFISQSIERVKSQVIDQSNRVFPIQVVVKTAPPLWTMRGFEIAAEVCFNKLIESLKADARFTITTASAD